MVLISFKSDGSSVMLGRFTSTTTSMVPPSTSSAALGPVRNISSGYSPPPVNRSIMGRTEEVTSLTTILAFLFMAMAMR